MVKIELQARFIHKLSERRKYIFPYKKEKLVLKMCTIN